MKYKITKGPSATPIFIVGQYYIRSEHYIRSEQGNLYYCLELKHIDNLTELKDLFRYTALLNLNTGNITKTEQYVRNNFTKVAKGSTILITIE